MNLDKYLVNDSLTCINFIKNKLFDLKLNNLSKHLYHFGNEFINLYSKIEEKIILSELDYQISINKSNNPHFINFLSQNNIHLFNNSINNKSINEISESLSILNKDTIDYYYNLAVQNYKPLQQYKELYHRFCPLIIQFSIEQKINNLKIISSSYENVKIELKIYTESLSLKHSFIVDFLTRLLTINKISKIPRSQIICKLWLTNHKKKLPKFKFLSSHCVNTASTYCNNCNDIKIWRIEECKKVACHEIFHCIGLDFHNIPYFFNTKLKSVFNIDDSNEILIFESYVELWATIINCICFSKKIVNSLDLLNQFINYEIYFSIFQTSKIINFFGFDKFEDFFNIDGFEYKEKNYKQNTCVISYYIIKSALLYSLNDFVNFCFQNNKDSIINFYESDKSYYYLLQLILSSLNNQNYKNNVNKMIKIIQSCDKKNFIYQQLRMTCLEYY